MRVVIDINVFVSAALKGVSWPGQTLRWLGDYGGMLKPLSPSKTLRWFCSARALRRKSPQLFLKILVGYFLPLNWLR